MHLKVKIDVVLRETLLLTYTETEAWGLQNRAPDVSVKKQFSNVCCT